MEVCFRCLVREKNMEILNKESQQEVEIPNDKYRFGTLDEYDERGMFEGAATICYVLASLIIVVLVILITIVVKIL